MSLLVGTTRIRDSPLYPPGYSGDVSTDSSRRHIQTQPSPSAEAVASILENLIAEAGLQMQARSGGASVCGYARTGTAVPPLKYSEGRWAALREVQRRAATGDLAAAVEHTRAAWAQDLARRRESSGSDWIAYRSGGVEALQDINARLPLSD